MRNEPPKPFVPSEEVILYNIGMSNYKEGKYAEALQRFERLQDMDVELHPRIEAEIWKAIATCRLALDDETEQKEIA